MRMETVATAARWICPTCHTRRSSHFCPACGESPPDARDLTVRGLLHSVGTDLTSIDGRLIRSFRALVTRPGALTVDFVEGRRKPYLAPFQLFLIVNVVFFAVQSLTHGSVLSSSLHSHMHRQDWSALARSLVARRLEAKGVALAAYAPVFDQAVVVNAKALVALMVLPFALALAVVFFRSRRPIVAHVVFSLHLYAFVLLLFCASLALARLDELTGGGGLQAAWMDEALTALILAASMVYLYRATGRVYQAAGAGRVVKAMGLALAMGAITMGYRFLVFIITLYST